MKKYIGLGMLLASLTAMACPQGTDSRGNVNGVARCAIKGTYLSAELRLTSNYEYILEDSVFIGDDNKENSTLRIESGTKILGMPGTFISIMRGSKIYAEGTATKPIMFTSLKSTERKRGEWGGLVINGNAPINACAKGVAVCEAISEGIKSKEVKFGGNDAEDNSGVLKYVVVEFAGYPISQDNELNGITFNAVGSGTEVDYIQVHMNADDGVEFFGGTVNVKHLVLTANEDDSMDWDMGWVGKVQFVLIDQGQDTVDNGFEADNLKSPMNALPRSNPMMSNVTMIGSPKSAYGMLLRRGTGAQLSNFIMTGFTKACIDIDDSETFKNAASVNEQGALTATGLAMTYSLLNCPKSFEAEANDPWSTEAWYKSQVGNKLGNPDLSGWMLSATSPAWNMGMTPDDFFFEPVEYVGALGKTDWTQGWISQSLQ